MKYSKLKRLCFLLFICLFLQGCSGTGFDKRATLMPDSMSISVGEQKLLPFDGRWSGVIGSLTWNFE